LSYRVKKLQWNPEIDEMCSSEVVLNRVFWCVKEDEVWKCLVDGEIFQTVNTLDEAKAACQAHWETTVKTVIEQE